jgi:hypothetical protein
VIRIEPVVIPVMTHAILHIEHAIPFNGDIIPGMDRRVVFVIRYSLHFPFEPVFFMGLMGLW